MDFQALNELIAPPDEQARAASIAQWNRVAKPIGSLGLLEDAVAQIAALTGSADVALDKRAVVVMCADNGVVDDVMMGYFHDTLATARAIKNDWFYTGDLGYLDNDGFLYLKGRSKNVIVLKNGKNVFPEELESLVEPLPYVKECMVLGVPRRGRDKDDLVICLKIVYDAAYVAQCLGEENLRSCIEKDIDKLNQRLPKFKKIHKLVITDQPLVRTSTSKVKRFEEGRLLASTGS